MAKFDPFFSLDCSRVEGEGGIQERKGSNFAAKRSRAIVQKPEVRRAKRISSKNLAIAIWQPWRRLNEAAAQRSATAAAAAESPELSANQRSEFIFLERREEEAETERARARNHRVAAAAPPRLLCRRRST